MQEIVVALAFWPMTLTFNRNPSLTMIFYIDKDKEDPLGGCTVVVYTPLGNIHTGRIVISPCNAVIGLVTKIWKIIFR